MTDKKNGTVASTRNRKPQKPGKSAGRPKDSGGVDSKLRIWTRQESISESQRQAAYRYLRRKGLFEGGSHPARLARPEARTVMLNVLSLDEVFGIHRDVTDTVTRVMTRDIGQEELAKKLQDVEQEIKRRFEIYGYWAQRIATLKSLLLDEEVNLKEVCLDERLAEMLNTGKAMKPRSFGLRAVQQLERAEEKSRRWGATADTLAEQADAYMALGDLEKAAEKAREAIAEDQNHARAWFIRVMVALRLRNAALREMQHHEMVAEEIAEPMSAHESWARELADEESNRAYRHNDDLNRILPLALTHWPRKPGGQYDHHEERWIFVIYSSNRLSCAHSRQTPT